MNLQTRAAILQSPTTWVLLRRGEKQMFRTNLSINPDVVTIFYMRGYKGVIHCSESRGLLSRIEAHYNWRQAVSQTIRSMRHNVRRSIQLAQQQQP